MVAREYYGATPATDRDLVSSSYLNALLADKNLGQDTITALITRGSSGYANKAYVDAADAAEPAPGPAQRRQRRFFCGGRIARR